MAKKTDYQIQTEIELKYGKEHTITKVYGTTVQLNELPDDVSVVAGDMKTYHFQLKKKALQSIN